MRNSLKLGAVFGAIGLSVTLQACAPIHEYGSGSFSLASLASPGSIQAFSSSLYPVVRENCGGCHGAGQFPMFAVSDVTMAHNTILGFGLVNLQNPATSNLVTKILGGHNGISPAVATSIQTQIQAWASGALGSNDVEDSQP